MLFLRPIRAGHRVGNFLGEIETLERRLLFAAGVRSFDGSGNNLAHTDWGSAGSTLLRLAPSQYADGLSAPRRCDAALAARDQ